MRIEIIKYPTDEDWLLVRNSALFTHRKSSDKTPSSSLRMKYIASEHSPIRDLIVVANFYDIPSWVSVHLIRHHEGFQPFISSQRNDIQHEYDRNSARQDVPVNMRFSANAQAIINISRKRLCNKASKETHELWDNFLVELNFVFPEIIKFCVPECVYRGGVCPEVFGCCGYNKTKIFDVKLSRYKTLFTGENMPN